VAFTGAHSAHRSWIDALLRAILLAAIAAGFGLAASSLPGTVVLVGAAGVLGICALTTRVNPAEAMLTASLVLGITTITWTNVRLPGNVTLADPFLLLAATAVVVLPSSTLAAIRSSRASTLFLWFASLLLVGGLIGGALSKLGDSGYAEAARFAVGIGVCVTLAPAVVANPRLTRLASWCWVSGATASVAWAAVAGAAARGRWYGLTIHPNHFGISLVASAFLALYLLRTSRGGSRMIAGVCFVAATAGIVGSGSRGALLGLTVGLVGLALLQGLRGARVLLIVGGLAITALAIGYPSDSTGGASAIDRLLFSGAGSDVATASRVEYLGEATAMFASHPLTGVGFSEARSAHSLFLQVPVTAGILGLAALTALALFWMTIWRTASRHRNSWILCTTAAGVLALAVALLVSNNLWDRYLLLYLAIAAQLSTVATHLSPRAEVQMS
jgi:hypothetical protein